MAVRSLKEERIEKNIRDKNNEKVENIKTTNEERMENVLKKKRMMSAERERKLLESLQKE